MSADDPSAAPHPHVPFPEQPELRGPLPNGLYVRPANGMTSMFYKYEPLDAQWYWTPDAAQQFWMPTSTLVVSHGKWAGKKPAFFNVAIIEWLHATRQAPPADRAPIELETIKAEFLANPPVQQASEAAKINASLGTSSVQSTAVVRGERDVADGQLDKERVKMRDTLVIKDCHKCTYTLSAYCTKLHMDDCSDITLRVDGEAGAKIISAVAELYKCARVTLELGSAVKTLQVDACDTVSATWTRAPDDFHSVVWAGTKALSLRVPQSTADADTAAELTVETGVDALRAADPDATIRDDIDQYITRVVDGKLLTEKLIRLANGFPSTVREKAEFDARQERNMEAFVKNSGLKIVRTKHVKEKEQGRNEKCACNSGKKYKNCCAGKNAESKVAFPNSAK